MARDDGDPLACAPKLSAEEFVSEDWVAVGEAIVGRRHELKLKQYELADLSNVSTSMIREIEQHEIIRRRHPRILESLSEALNWPRWHLDTVLHGGQAQEPGKRSELESRLEMVERRLDQIVDVVNRINDKVDIIIDIQHGRPGR